jgi:hypothetical protein
MKKIILFVSILVFSISSFAQTSTILPNSIYVSSPSQMQVISGNATSPNPTTFTIGVIGTNYSTNGFGMGVVGIHSGGGIGVLGESYVNGIGIYGKSVSNTGVRAESQTGVGLVASSNTGTALDVSSMEGEAIHANSINNHALNAFSNKGLGLKAESLDSMAIWAKSTNDLAVYIESPVMALKTLGKLEFGGAQMQAATGKFLKSLDDFGQAQWQELFPISTSSAASTRLLDITNSKLNSDQTRAIYGMVNDEGVAIQGIANKINPTTITMGLFGLNKSTSLWGFGVRGTHEGSGVGVYGNVIGAGTGVQGVANNATATAGLFSSQNGYGLKSSGKIAFSGGDTNPAEGKVLTAKNASGDAEWKNIKQKRQIGFSVPIATKVMPLSNTSYEFNFGTPLFVDDEGLGTISTPLFDASNGGRFNVLEDGVYLLKFEMSWTTANANNTNLSFSLNNSTVLESNFFYNSVPGQKFGLNTIAKLQKGNYVHPLVNHASASAMTVSDTYAGRFSVVKIY